MADLPGAPGRPADHADHDPLLIAADLDPDPGPSERETARAMIATCPDCAALHADLLALSRATREQPTPTRPRDFRLSPSDAARLATPAAGEPIGPTARLAGVMTDPTTGSRHPSHDTMLVASLADHSLAPSDRASAEALVATCHECADLHTDLVALRDATRAMSTPARPRDFTLTAADAARLRRRGWRRFVAGFGSPGDVFSRPLAAGLTTLGLVGILVGSAPSVLNLPFGSSSATQSTAGAPLGANGEANPALGQDRAPAAVPSSGAGFVPLAPTATGAVAPAAAASAAPAAAAAPSAAPAAPVASGAAPAAGATGAPGDGTVLAPYQPDQLSPQPVAGAETPGYAKGAETQASAPAAAERPNERPNDVLGAQRDAAVDAGPGIPLLLIVSGAFLLAGLGLFAIRWTARRLGDG